MADGDAAVDEEGLAGDVGGSFAGEEEEGAVEIAGFAWSAEGDAFAEVIDPACVVVHDAVLFGAEPAWGEAIDGDVVGAPVGGETHGELFDAAAAGSVWGEAGVTGDAGDGADVDDAAGLALDHAAGDGLADEEGAAEVGFEDGVPVVPCDFEGWFAAIAAGVIDEDVDAAEGGFCGGGGELDAVEVSDIEGNGGAAAAEGDDGVCGGSAVCGVAG